MNNLFSKSRLTHKDLVYFFQCSSSQPFHWKQNKITNPEQLPFRKGTIAAYTFDDMRSIREYSYPESLKFKGKNILFYNIKGGCGKTTTSSQIIFLLSLMGYRILAIDLDPQQDLTYALGIDPYKVEKSIYDIIIKKTPVRDAITKLNSNLHVIASNKEMDLLDNELIGVPGSENLVGNIINEVASDYDLVICDSHPIRNRLNISAMFASDLVCVPTFCDIFGYRGVLRTMEHIVDIATEISEEDINNLVRIIPVKYNKRRSQEKDYYAELLKEYAHITTDYISNGALFQKATDFSLSIFNMKKAFNAIDSIEALLENPSLFIGLYTRDAVCVELLSVTNDILDFMRK